MSGWRKLGLLPVLAVGLGLGLSAPVAAQTSLKMQASWAAALTQYGCSAKNLVFKAIHDLQQGLASIPLSAEHLHYPAYDPTIKQSLHGK